MRPTPKLLELVSLNKLHAWHFDHKEYEDGINLLFATKWSMFFIKMGLKKNQKI